MSPFQAFKPGQNDNWPEIFSSADYHLCTADSQTHIITDNGVHIKL